MARVQGLLPRLDDWCRRREIRLADLQMDDIVTGRLACLGGLLQVHHAEGGNALQSRAPGHGGLLCT